MGCYRPIPAFQDRPGGSVRLHPPLGMENVRLPCGLCIGCRTARALEWARRCSHEAARWQDNCFVTLTYSEDRLPSGGCLEPVELAKFFKRLRRYAESSESAVLSDRLHGLRYFACGEYGNRSGRPHYHALLFNCSFSDGKRVGEELFESVALAQLWPQGSNRIGRATPASANYIAQYSLKKIRGKLDCDADGVVRPQPFLRMSLKPGIGTEFVKQYGADLSGGFLVSGDGRKGPIPRAYMSKLEPAVVEELKFLAYQRRPDAECNSAARLEASEVIHHSRKALLESRSL